MESEGLNRQHMEEEVLLFTKGIKLTDSFAKSRQSYDPALSHQTPPPPPHVAQKSLDNNIQVFMMFELLNLFRDPTPLMIRTYS